MTVRIFQPPKIIISFHLITPMSSLLVNFYLFPEHSELESIEVNKIVVSQILVSKPQYVTFPGVGFADKRGYEREDEAEAGKAHLQASDTQALQQSGPQQFLRASRAEAVWPARSSGAPTVSNCERLSACCFKLLSL